MKLFQQKKPNRKPQAITKSRFAPESLEARRLMAADAFNFQVLEDPTSVAITAEMYQTVDELADLVRQQVPPDQFELAMELEQPEILFDAIGGELFQPIVDAADIPGLGQAIGQDAQLGKSLNDMVLLDLMDVPEDAPEFVQQMNLFLNELDCQLDLFAHLDATDSQIDLPPQFEQLRMELGDQGFADWQSNQEQTGTLSGIDRGQIEQLDAEQLHDLDQQEAALDRWLVAFSDPMPMPSPELPEKIETFRVEQGDKWLAIWLESNAALFGNHLGLPEQQLVELEFDDFGLMEFQQQDQVLGDWLRTVGQPLLLPPAGQAIDMEVPLGFAEQLPQQMEGLRLAIGNESFAAWLESNLAQFGNAMGVQDANWLTPEMQSQEQVLLEWLDSYQFVPTVFELAGDTDGDGIVAFNDFLTLSSNFGTTVDTGYLAGDFDLDGTVAFSDFLVLSSNYGTTETPCDCDTSDANNPEGAKEIQKGGELEIREGSIVFVSDKTVAGDAALIKEDVPAGTKIHEGNKSWQDVIDKIKNMPDGSIKGDLVISGHGAQGGVQGSNGDLDGQDITEEQAAILKKKLGAGARIVILGCCQANKELDEHMQRLADLTGASVVGNQGAVNNGANGKDDWFEFQPAKK